MAKTRFKNKKILQLYCCVSGIVHSGISSHTSFTLFFFKADFAVVLFSRCKLSWRIQLSVVSDKV